VSDDEGNPLRITADDQRNWNEINDLRAKLAEAESARDRWYNEHQRVLDVKNELVGEVERLKSDQKLHYPNTKHLHEEIARLKADNKTLIEEAQTFDVIGRDEAYAEIPRLRAEIAELKRFYAEDAERELKLRGQLTKEREINKVYEIALEFYAAMRFNREKMEWMPGNPDKAANALAQAKELRK
jgi:hypothetical protein